MPAALKQTEISFADKTLKSLAKQPSPEKKVFYSQKGQAKHPLKLLHSPSGSLSWYHRRRYPLGSYPAMSLSEATEKANKYTREIEAGRDPKAAKQKAGSKGTIGELFLNWLDNRAGITESTRSKYRECHSLFLEPSGLATKPIEDLTTDILLKAYNGRLAVAKKNGSSGGAAETNLKALRVFCNSLVLDEVILVNPVTKLLKQKKVTIKQNIDYEVMDLKDVRSFYEALQQDSNQNLANIAELLLFTGLRPSEICSLQIQDLNLSNEPTVKLRDTKRAAFAELPLNRQAAKVMESAVGDRESGYVFQNTKGKPYAASDISKLMGRVCRDAAITRAKPKTLRKLFATIGDLTELNLKVHNVERLQLHDPSSVHHKHYSLANIGEMRTTSQTIGNHISKLVEQSVPVEPYAAGFIEGVATGESLQGEAPPPYLQRSDRGDERQPATCKADKRLAWILRAADHLPKDQQQIITQAVDDILCSQHHILS